MSGAIRRARVGRRQTRRRAPRSGAGHAARLATARVLLARRWPAVWCAAPQCALESMVAGKAVPAAHNVPATFAEQQVIATTEAAEKTGSAILNPFAQSAPAPTGAAPGADIGDASLAIALSLAGCALIGWMLARLRD